jgi:hypothetical protein
MGFRFLRANIAGVVCVCDFAVSQHLVFDDEEDGASAGELFRGGQFEPSNTMGGVVVPIRWLGCGPKCRRWGLTGAS